MGTRPRRGCELARCWAMLKAEVVLKDALLGGVGWGG